MRAGAGPLQDAQASPGHSIIGQLIKPDTFKRPKRMHTPEEPQSIEIDLRFLFAALWQRRRLILAVTAFFTLTSGAYAWWLAPQEWSAKAMVTAPSYPHVEQLQLRLEQLIELTQVSSTDYTAFVTAFSEPNLFNDFILAFNTFNNKSEFLTTRGYTPPQAMQQEPAKQRFLAKSTKKISATQKKQEPFYTLSFSAETAEDAHKRLSEYLDFIQAKEVAMKNLQLTGKIESQIKAVNFSLQVQKASALKRLQEDITRTEFALRVSKAAGVENPVQNLNHQTYFTIDLGAKALQEKLKILKEIKNPEMLDPQLASVLLQLDSLQALPLAKVDFASYRFLQSPAEPLSHDRPKRAFIVVMATIVGLILGVMVASYRSYRPRETADNRTGDLAQPTKAKAAKDSQVGSGW